ncbi:hypothetical protein DRP77_02310, partial [Candidatus Poribacteria bacterium]
MRTVGAGIAMVIVILSGCYGGIASAGPAGFTMVEEGRPVSAIVIGGEASPTERHAAAELAKYVEMMSGAALPLLVEGEAKGFANLVLIGRPETNGLIRELTEKGALQLSEDWPGLDGFVIKTAREGDKSFLVLGGSRDRGTLYAVYHLLERFLHVGFFWDGDFVPERATISLPPIDLAERPRFRIRLSISGCGCAATYSYAGFWGFEEWKRELDWLVKNKFNTVLLTIGGEVVRKLAEERMGLGRRPITEADRGKMELAKRVFDYVRTLDLEAITPFPSTQVPEEFVKAHPEGRYFAAGWFIEKELGRPLPRHIHPADPLYRRWVETYIRAWNEVYGTWHLYYGCDPYSEAHFETSDEERRRIQVSLPLGALKGIRAADPEGIWHLSGWPFVFDRRFWPEETLQEFLRNIPPGGAVIWDLWCDRHPVYKQERAKYFAGREFILCFLHQFGGDDGLRGDMGGAIRIVKEAARDERARNCVGFGLTMEVLHYTVHYYDLLAKLAWSPDEVELPSYLDDLTLRRYGREVFGPMRKAVQALASTVYGPLGSSEARYQHRLYPFESPHPSLPPPQALAVLEGLEEFMRTALSLPPNALGNRLLQNDLVDAFRQYVTELFNLHLNLLESAFASGDSEAFEREAGVLSLLLDQLEKVLSARDDYRIEAVVERLSRHPTNPSPEALRRWIRDQGLTFAASIPNLIDYQSKDVYELVRFYYRPRAEAYVNLLRERMRRGETRVSREELDSLYRAIELRWVEEGYDPGNAPPYEGPMWKAVEEAFERLSSDPEVRAVWKAFRPRKGLVNPDFEEGLAGWFMRLTEGAEVRTSGERASSGKRSLHLKLIPLKGVMKSAQVWQILTAPESFSLEFDYFIVSHTELANAGVMVEGFDGRGRKV